MKNKLLQIRKGSLTMQCGLFDRCARKARNAYRHLVWVAGHACGEHLWINRRRMLKVVLWGSF